MHDVCHFPPYCTWFGPFLLIALSPPILTGATAHGEPWPLLRCSPLVSNLWFTYPFKCLCPAEIAESSLTIKVLYRMEVISPRPTSLKEQAEPPFAASAPLSSRTREILPVAALRPAQLPGSCDHASTPPPPSPLLRRILFVSQHHHWCVLCWPSQFP
jgi:hypothetical protein